jgi:hypothetical protein
VLANTAFYRSRDHGAGVGPVAFLPEPQAEEGITCVVCHVREGGVLAVDGVGAHRFVAAPALATSAVCGSCHEFPFLTYAGAELVSTGTPMQRTYSEWSASGSTQTCQDCHMPGGRHLFRGAHDVAFLAGSVAVEAGVEGDRGRLRLRSVGVGHDLPTGDLFRHLTVEVSRGDGYAVVARIGRTFRTRFDPDLQLTVKELDADTSLRPGEVRVLDVPRGVAWRLVYHYASELDEARGRIPADELTTTLAEGRIP